MKWPCNVCFLSIVKSRREGDRAESGLREASKVADVAFKDLPSSPQFHSGQGKTYQGVSLTTLRPLDCCSWRFCHLTKQVLKLRAFIHVGESNTFCGQ